MATSFAAINLQTLSPKPLQGHTKRAPVVQDGLGASSGVHCHVLRASTDQQRVNGRVRNWAHRVSGLQEDTHLRTVKQTCPNQFLGTGVDSLSTTRFARRVPVQKSGLSRAAIGPSTATSPVIDVEGISKPIKFIVLGGNGFVGSQVVKAALDKGYEVTSINRSGRPTVSEAWVYQAQWITADVFSSDLESLFEGASAVMSCLGGFGSNEQMERICGDATVRAVEAAKNAGVPRFIFVSVHDYNLPSGVKDSIGYFVGKKKAEKRIMELFPTTGVILRPGFIYGSRRVPQANNISIPLTPIGAALEKSLGILPEALLQTLGKVPGSDVVIAPPIDVDDVARAAVEAVRDETLSGVLDIKAIKRVAL